MSITFTPLLTELTLIHSLIRLLTVRYISQSSAGQEGFELAIYSRDGTTALLWLCILERMPGATST